MNTQNRLNRLERGQKQVLKKRIEQLRPLLQVEGTFTVRDLDYQPTRMEVFKQIGVLEKVGTTIEEDNPDDRDGRNNRTVLNEWRWRPRQREFVEKHLQERDTLPCGEDHPLHVCNPKDMDGYSCKYCREEGKEPHFSRETIKQLFNND